MLYWIIQIPPWVSLSNTPACVVVTIRVPSVNAPVPQAPGPIGIGFSLTLIYTETSDGFSKIMELSMLRNSGAPAYAVVRPTKRNEAVITVKESPMVLDFFI